VLDSFRVNRPVPWVKIQQVVDRFLSQGCGFAPRSDGAQQHALHALSTQNHSVDEGRLAYSRDERSQQRWVQELQSAPFTLFLDLFVLSEALRKVNLRLSSW